MSARTVAGVALSGVVLGACAGPRPPPERASHEPECAEVVLEGAQAAQIDSGSELRHAWRSSASDRGGLDVRVESGRATIAIHAADCAALIALLESRRVQAHEGHAAAIAFLVEQRAAIQARLDAAIAAEDAFTREHGTADARGARSAELARDLQRARGRTRERLVEEQLGLSVRAIDGERLEREVANERALLASIDVRAAEMPVAAAPFEPGQCRARPCAR